MNNKVVGLDIAKNIFHLYSLEADGKTTKKKLKRAELLRFFANYPVSCVVWKRVVERITGQGN
jgi:hypothetical protein